KEAVNVCARPRRGRAACDAMRVVYKRVPKNSPAAAAAAAAATPSSLNFGPAGGFSPIQVAKAYNLNADSSTAANQTIATVDAHDDPIALTDLNTFDATYGLPAETNGTSFKKVNQTGGSTPPSTDSDWAVEISLDVQTVRGLCHQCKILLIETNDDTFTNLA